MDHHLKFLSNFMIRFCMLSEEMKKTQQANTAIMKCLECSCGYGYLWVRMFLILSILRDSIRRPEGCLRSFSLPIKILHPKSVIHVPTRETISVLYLLRNVSDLWPDLGARPRVASRGKKEEGFPVPQRNSARISHRIRCCSLLVWGRGGGGRRSW